MSSQTSSATFHGKRYLSQLSGSGIPYRIIGSRTPYRGWGSKWHAVQQELHGLPSETIVTVSDSRDVLLNRLGGSDDSGGTSSVENLVSTFKRLLQGAPAGAIVAGTEGRCCVSAMTNFRPGELFDAEGRRNARACRSGQHGCPWQGAGRRPWQQFMGSLAVKRGTDSVERYLNAGLMAGRAVDLLRVIDYIDIREDEDDQAVFSDLLYREPDMIVLDYKQELFGNSRYWLGIDNGGCPYSLDMSTRRLRHDDYGTHPVFVHAAAGFWECLDSMALSLAQEVPDPELRKFEEVGVRRLQYGPLTDTSTTTVALTSSTTDSTIKITSATATATTTTTALTTTSTSISMDVTSIDGDSADNTSNTSSGMSFANTSTDMSFALNFLGDGDADDLVSSAGFSALGQGLWWSHRSAGTLWALLAFHGLIAFAACWRAQRLSQEVDVIKKLRERHRLCGIVSSSLKNGNQKRSRTLCVFSPHQECPFVRQPSGMQLSRLSWKGALAAGKLNDRHWSRSIPLWLMINVMHVDMDPDDYMTRSLNHGVWAGVVAKCVQMSVSADLGFSGARAYHLAEWNVPGAFVPSASPSKALHANCDWFAQKPELGCRLAESLERKQRAVLECQAHLIELDLFYGRPPGLVPDPVHHSQALAHAGCDSPRHYFRRTGACRSLGERARRFRVAELRRGCFERMVSAGHWHRSGYKRICSASCRPRLSLG
jgi:hypothetical protein